MNAELEQTQDLQPKPEGNFVVVQQQFAAHLRNPQAHSAPSDIEDRRMAIYRDLFYKNIEGFLKSGFPVLYKITPQEQWHEMVRDFFWKHQSQTPYFMEICQEFLNYLSTEREHPNDPPFLLELAYYEWVELDLDIKPLPANYPVPDPDADIFADRVIVSPFLHTMVFKFPVHQISPDFLPDEPPPNPTYLVVYRQGTKVKFLNVNALTCRLIQLIQTNDALSGREVLGKLSEEFTQFSEQQLFDFGSPMLLDFQDKGIILGAVKSNPVNA